jgi:hypothetical protein
MIIKNCLKIVNCLNNLYEILLYKRENVSYRKYYLTYSKIKIV